MTGPTLKQAKLAVTGGFRSRSACEKAIKDKSCDIIGLARPLTAEPAYSNDILNGKIEAARENKVSILDSQLTWPSLTIFLTHQVDPSVQTATSIYQIGQISRGEPIADLSDDAVADKTLKYATGQEIAPKYEEGKPE